MLPGPSAVQLRFWGYQTARSVLLILWSIYINTYVNVVHVSNAIYGHRSEVIWVRVKWLRSILNTLPLWLGSWKRKRIWILQGWCVFFFCHVTNPSPHCNVHGGAFKSPLSAYLLTQSGLGVALMHAWLQFSKLTILLEFCILWGIVISQSSRNIALCEWGLSISASVVYY